MSSSKSGVSRNSSEEHKLRCTPLRYIKLTSEPPDDADAGADAADAADGTEDSIDERSTLTGKLLFNIPANECGCENFGCSSIETTGTELSQWLAFLYEFIYAIATGKANANDKVIYSNCRASIVVEDIRKNSDGELLMRRIHVYEGRNCNFKEILNMLLSRNRLRRETLDNLTKLSPKYEKLKSGMSKQEQLSVKVSTEKEYIDKLSLLNRISNCSTRYSVNNAETEEITPGIFFAFPTNNDRVNDHGQPTDLYTRFAIPSLGPDHAFNNPRTYRTSQGVHEAIHLNRIETEEATSSIYKIEPNVLPNLINKHSLQYTENNKFMVGISKEKVNLAGDSLSKYMFPKNHATEIAIGAMFSELKDYIANDVEEDMNNINKQRIIQDKYNTIFGNKKNIKGLCTKRRYIIVVNDHHIVSANQLLDTVFGYNRSVYNETDNRLWFIRNFKDNNSVQPSDEGFYLPSGVGRWKVEGELYKEEKNLANRSLTHEELSTHRGLDTFNDYHYKLEKRKAQYLNQSLQEGNTLWNVEKGMNRATQQVTDAYKDFMRPSVYMEPPQLKNINHHRRTLKCVSCGKGVRQCNYAVCKEVVRLDGIYCEAEMYKATVAPVKIRYKNMSVMANHLIAHNLFFDEFGFEPTSSSKCGPSSTHHRELIYHIICIGPEAYRMEQTLKNNVFHQGKGGVGKSWIMEVLTLSMPPGVCEDISMMTKKSMVSGSTVYFVEFFVYFLIGSFFLFLTLFLFYLSFCLSLYMMIMILKFWFLMKCQPC